jgi:hypothetical protein
MDTNTLKAHVKQVLAGYVKPAFNGYTYLTTDANETRFIVTGVGKTRSGRVVNTAIIVEIVGDTLVIDRDINSKPFVSELVEAGVPREQIILAYKGEAVPESVS